MSTSQNSYRLVAHQIFSIMDSKFGHHCSLFAAPFATFVSTPTTFLPKYRMRYFFTVNPPFARRPSANNILCMGSPCSVLLQKIIHQRERTRRHAGVFYMWQYFFVAIIRCHSLFFGTRRRMEGKKTRLVVVYNRIR